jgi:hypothetical protein
VLLFLFVVLHFCLVSSEWKNSEQEYGELHLNSSTQKKEVMSAEVDKWKNNVQGEGQDNLFLW